MDHCHCSSNLVNRRLVEKGSFEDEFAMPFKDGPHSKVEESSQSHGISPLTPLRYSKVRKPWSALTRPICTNKSPGGSSADASSPDDDTHQDDDELLLAQIAADLESSSSYLLREYEGEGDDRMSSPSEDERFYSALDSIIDSTRVASLTHEADPSAFPTNDENVEFIKVAEQDAEAGRVLASTEDYSEYSDYSALFDNEQQQRNEGHSTSHPSRFERSTSPSPPRYARYASPEAFIEPLSPRSENDTLAVCRELSSEELEHYKSEECRRGRKRHRDTSQQHSLEDTLRQKRARTGIKQGVYSPGPGYAIRQRGEVGLGF